MARSAIGLFGIFGRSSDLRQLDDALRSVDIHPRMIAEAVKLTTVKLIEEHLGREPRPADYRRAAEMIGYCLLGPERFAGANDVALAEAVEARIEAALAAGEGLDSRLVLLAIHAKFIEASIVDRYGLEAAEE